MVASASTVTSVPTGAFDGRAIEDKEMTTQRKVSPESQRNEYKSSWQDEYFECLCGFANARGGKLYVGVNDDGYVVGSAARNAYSTRCQTKRLPLWES